MPTSFNLFYTVQQYNTVWRVLRKTSMFPKKFGTIDFVMISAELIDYLEPEQKYDCKQIGGKFNKVN